MLIAGSSSNLSAPAAPTVTKRTAGSNETTVGANTYYKVFVTATNFFGETVQSSVGDASATTSGQVVDVTIVPVQGAMNYNIYVSTASSASTANEYLAAAGVGGTKFTLQGTPPSSGATPPAADSGTGASTRFEGCHPHPVRPVRGGGNLPDVADGLAGGLLQQQRRHAPVLQRDLHGAEGPVAVDVEQPGLVPGRPGGDRLLRYRHRQPVATTSSRRAPAPTTSCSSSRAASVTSPSVRP